MEDVIQKLEEKRALYQGQIREIEEHLQRLEQALAALKSDRTPAGPSESEREEPPVMPSAAEPATISARTPWP